MFNMSCKISFVSAFLGSVSYTVLALIPETTIAYFVATLTLALLSEFFARITKTPSTIYIIICIYIFVPGYGVYETIINLINARYTEAMALGGNTLINLTLMSMAIAISSFISKHFFAFKGVKNCNTTKME